MLPYIGVCIYMKRAGVRCFSTDITLHIYFAVGCSVSLGSTAFETNAVCEDEFLAFLKWFLAEC